MLKVCACEEVGAHHFQTIASKFAAFRHLGKRKEIGIISIIRKRHLMAVWTN